MYYDDSSRRLNLLSGLVFGTVLGAGLALLFVPGERMEGGRRIVVRAADLPAISDASSALGRPVTTFS